MPIDEVLELGIAGREEALRYYRGVGLSRVLVEQIENPIVSVALESKVHFHDRDQALAEDMTRREPADVGDPRHRSPNVLVGAVEVQNFPFHIPAARTPAVCINNLSIVMLQHNNHNLCGRGKGRTVCIS